MLTRTRTIWLASLMLLGATTAFAAVPAELTGQVVCSQCWFEADRDTTPYGTAADLACAARCAKENVPPALAVRNEGGYELLLLAGDRDWQSLIGRFATVRGAVDEREGRRVLRAEAVDELAKSPWPAPSAEAEDVALAWTDLGGQGQTLAAFRGRIVVLNFWATWCAPCRKEMPDLVRIQNRYGMYGVQVLGAAADPPDAAATVAEFARKLRVNFPVLLGASSPQMESLGVGVALPATVVIDRHGHVVERIAGVVERERLEALLDRMLHQEVAGAGAEHDTANVAHATGPGHRHGPPGGTQASLVPS